METKKKKSDLKKEIKKSLEEEGLLTNRTSVEQPNLFGDQDFVFNVLQTEITGIREQIESTQKSIERKETLLGDLGARKQEVEKAAKIIADQKKAMEAKHGK